MVRALVIVVLVTAHAPVRADGSCPPAVALTGDDAVVRMVREQLDARGIAGETPSCPVLHAQLERRGAHLIVRIERPATDAVAGPGAASGARAGSSATTSDGAANAATAATADAIRDARPGKPSSMAPGKPLGTAREAARGAAPGAARAAPTDRVPGDPAMAGATIERTVGGPATAATVIESWVRSDVAAPLLETRAVAMTGAESAAPVAAAASGASVPAATGIQLFVAAETSLGSDRTVWQGMQLGACVMLGPICVAARLHGGKVIAKPGGWDGFVRKGAEAYGGIDIPIAVGRTRLTPGFAAGYGTMLTHHIGNGDDKTGIEISGPRAEAHVSWAIPLTPHLALDLETTAELTQATGTETHGAPNAADPAVVYPDAPRALFRLAVGVRYGAL